MQPESLTIRGVTRYADELTVDFSGVPPGLVAVVGGNGAGKSTLLECMLPAAIYRSFPSRPGNLYDHVTRRDALIEATFQYRGSRWRAQHVLDCGTKVAGTGKGAGSNRPTLFRDGAVVEGTEGSADGFEAAVLKYLPARAVTLASVFAVQSGEGNFLTLTREQRRALFAELLGLEGMQELAVRAGRALAPLDAAAVKLDEESEAIARDEALRARLDGDRSAARARAEAAATARSDAAAVLAAAIRATTTAKSIRDGLVTARSRALDEQQRTTARRAAAADRRQRAETALTAARATVAEKAAILAAHERLVTLTTELAELDRAGADIGRRQEHHLGAKLRAERAVARAVEELDAIARQLSEINGTRARRGEVAARIADLEPVETKLAGLRTDAAELRATARRIADEAAATLNEKGRQAEAVKQRGIAAARAAEVLSKVPCGGRRALIFGSEADEDVGAGTRTDCGTCSLLGDAKAAEAALPGLREELTALHAELEAARKKAREAEEIRAAADEAASKLRDTEAQAATLRASRENLAEIDRAIAAAATIGARTAAAEAAGQEARAAVAVEVAALSALDAERAALAPRKQAVVTEQAMVRGAAQRRDALVQAEAAIPLHEATVASATSDERDAAEALSTLTVPPEPTEAAAAYTSALDAERARRTEDEAAALAERTARDEAAGLDGRITALGDIPARRAALAERRERVALRRQGFALLQRGFGRDGVQALRIDAAGPTVSRIVNGLLAKVVEGRFSVELVTTRATARGGPKEVFDLLVHDGLRGGAPRLPEVLSGGEQVLIDEALKLAIAVFNAGQHGGDFATIWRDECDGALEPALAMAYPSMLRAALDLGGFRNCYFITHRPEVADQADAVLRVDGGRAWIEVQ